MSGHLDRSSGVEIIFSWNSQYTQEELHDNKCNVPKGKSETVKDATIKSFDFNFYC